MTTIVAPLTPKRSRGNSTDQMAASTDSNEEKETTVVFQTIDEAFGALQSVTAPLPKKLQELILEKSKSMLKQYEEIRKIRDTVKRISTTDDAGEVRILKSVDKKDAELCPVTCPAYLKDDDGAKAILEEDRAHNAKFRMEKTKRIIKMTTRTQEWKENLLREDQYRGLRLIAKAMVITERKKDESMNETWLDEELTDEVVADYAVGKFLRESTYLAPNMFAASHLHKDGEEFATKYSAFHNVIVSASRSEKLEDTKGQNIVKHIHYNLGELYATMTLAIWDAAIAEETNVKTNQEIEELAQIEKQEESQRDVAMALDALAEEDQEQNFFEAHEGQFNKMMDSRIQRDKAKMNNRARKNCSGRGEADTPTPTSNGQKKRSKSKGKSTKQKQQQSKQQKQQQQNGSNQSKHNDNQGGQSGGGRGNNQRNGNNDSGRGRGGSGRGRSHRGGRAGSNKGRGGGGGREN